MAEVLSEFPMVYARLDRFLDGQVWHLLPNEVGKSANVKRNALTSAARRAGLRIRTLVTAEGGLVVQAYGHGITNAGDVSSDTASIDTANSSLVITRLP